MDKIKEMLKAESSHIFDAQQIAKGLHNRKPEVAIEMIREIKKYYVSLKETEIQEIENL